MKSKDLILEFQIKVACMSDYIYDMQKFDDKEAKQKVKDAKNKYNKLERAIKLLEEIFND